MSQDREIGTSGTVPTDADFGTAVAAAGKSPVQHEDGDWRWTPAGAVGAGEPLAGQDGEFSRSSPHEREHEKRPDRGWQKVGDVALRVVKAAVVTGAIRGYIPRPVASRIVGTKKLRDA